MQRLAVIAPFMIVVTALALSCVVCVDVLSAARAYVGGESLWSKAQKDAIAHLSHYVNTAEEESYLAFQSALTIPLGDRIARLELDEPRPDLERVRTGFVAGGNHPDDIAGMVRLYRSFRDVSFMAEAIAAWAEGDALIAQLQSLGDAARIRVRQADIGPEERRALLARMTALNTQLGELERRFSSALGRASRTSQQLLLSTTLLLAATLAAVGVAFILRTLTRQQHIERELRERNARWEMAAAIAGIGLFTWDTRRDEVMLDAHGEALFGNARPDAKVLRAALDAAVASGDGAAEFRTRWQPERGAARPIELIGRLPADARSKPTTLCGVVRNVGSPDNPTGLACVDLHDVLRQCVRAVEALRLQHAVGVQRRGPRDPLVVRAERTLLQQALVALLANAIQYSRRGSDVVLEWGACGCDAWFSVRDHGAGLSEAQIARLLQPFGSSDGAQAPLSAFSRRLALARNVLTRTGAQLEGTSRLGVGSTFTVRLPLA